MDSSMCEGGLKENNSDPTGTVSILTYLVETKQTRINISTNLYINDQDYNWSLVVII